MSIARLPLCVLTVAACSVLLGATGASATVECGSPDLPPGCGEYRTPAEVHAAFANPDPAIIELILKDISHSRFVLPVITPLGPDELEEFDSTVTGLFDVELVGPTLVTDVPFALSGPVTVLTTGKTGNTTGTFQTEIIAMSLTGNVFGLPVKIRESPTQNSTGQTTITDIGGGNFGFDSFFDIWVEISVNGGPFVPQTGGSSTVTLEDPDAQPVPLLPSAGFAALLGGLGLSGAWLLRQRRHA